MTRKERSQRRERERRAESRAGGSYARVGEEEEMDEDQMLKPESGMRSRRGCVLRKIRCLTRELTLSMTPTAADTAYSDRDGS